MSHPAENGDLRPNVLAVVVAERPGELVLFHRLEDSMGEDCWQFPQGGVDAGEPAEAALRRELREEIGVSRVEVVARAPQPLVYWYPPDVHAKLAAKNPDKARFKGQSQTWFLVRLLEGSGAIHFNHQPPEFDAWCWATPQQAVERAVAFKRQVYREGLAALGLL